MYAHSTSMQANARIRGMTCDMAAAFVSLASQLVQNNEIKIHITSGN